MTSQQLLNAAAATLAASVVTDSTTEHYRAGFHNPMMFVGPLVSAAMFVTTTNAALRSGGGGNSRSTILAGSVITGLMGFGFHVANTSRRVGGWSSSTNVFNGAPMAAPLATTIAGVLGLVAPRVRPRTTAVHVSSDLSGGRRGAVLVSVLSAVGLVGTAAEAAALHFRGAFQNPFMYAPVIVPPITAATLATAAVTRSPSACRAARSLLRLTGWLGIVGTCFHAWGVHRRMGGWHNWRQNVFAGPPLPAPPAFTGLSLAGLAALDLLESKDTK